MNGVSPMNIKRWITLAVLSLLVIASPLRGQAPPESQTSANSTQSTTSDTQKKSDTTQTKAPVAAEKPHYYTNSAGQRAQSPTKSSIVPPGAQEKCRSG